MIFSGDELAQAAFRKLVMIYLQDNSKSQQKIHETS